MPFSMVDNIMQWAGSLLSPASSSAGDGTQVGPSVRPIQRKYASVFTNTPLLANVTYLSSWIDTQGTGGVFLFGQVLSNQASAAIGFIIQGSNDISNPGLTAQIGTTAAGLFVSANVIGNVVAFCPYRYWRVQYTNGASTQGTFEIVVTESNIPPGITMGGTNFVNGWPTAWNIPYVGGTGGTSPNNVSIGPIATLSTNGTGGSTFDNGTTFEALTSQQGANISIGVTPLLQTSAAVTNGAVHRGTQLGVAQVEIGDVAIGFGLRQGGCSLLILRIDDIELPLRSRQRGAGPRA